MYSVNLEKEKSISVFVIGKKKKNIVGTGSCMGAFIYMVLLTLC